MITSLYQNIKEYQPYNIQEKQDQIVMLEYIEQFDNILTRDNHYGHFSSSPWIVNKDYTKVLMIYHNIYDSWGWCGGHADGDENLLYVALKEGKEETGVSLTPITRKILAIDILPVPPHVKKGCFVSSHVHLNVTYLCVADEAAPLHIKIDENSGVRWVPIDEVQTLVSEKDMKVVYAKLIEKANMYKKMFKK